MSVILRILLGLFIITVGFSIAYKTSFYLSFIGQIDWAEKNLGGGGSRLFYKFFGIAITIIGIIVLTNLWDKIIGGFFRWVFGG